MSPTSAASSPGQGLAGEGVLLRLREAEPVEPHPAQVTAPGARVGGADAGVLAGDDEVPAQRHVAPAADTPPVYLDDHGLRRAPQAHELRHRAEAGGGRPDEVLAGIPAAVGGEHLIPVVKALPEIEAGAEGAPRAPQDDHPHPLVGDRLLDRFLELVGHRWDDRVEALRAVEGDPRDPLVALVDQRLKGHGPRCYCSGVSGGACQARPVSTSSRPARREGRPLRRSAPVGHPVQGVGAPDGGPAQRLGLPGAREGPDPGRPRQLAVLADQQISERTPGEVRGRDALRPRSRPPRRGRGGGRRPPTRTSRAPRRARPTTRARARPPRPPGTSPRASPAAPQRCAERSPRRRRCASRSGRARPAPRSRSARRRCAAGTRTRAPRRPSAPARTSRSAPTPPSGSGSVTIIELLIGASARRWPGSEAV